jgi:hypothetical protein
MTLGTVAENGLNPNLIDEVSDSVTYLGFALEGDETKCAIQKIEKIGNETRMLCPYGRFDFDFNWSHRADSTYNYQLRKL